MSIMGSRWIDLVNEVGPSFAAKAAEHDAGDAFVATGLAPRLGWAGLPIRGGWPAPQPPLPRLPRPPATLSSPRTTRC